MTIINFPEWGQYWRGRGSHLLRERRRQRTHSDGGERREPGDGKTGEINYPARWWNKFNETFLILPRWRGEKRFRPETSKGCFLISLFTRSWVPWWLSRPPRTRTPALATLAATPSRRRSRRPRSPHTSATWPEPRSRSPSQRWRAGCSSTSSGTRSPTWSTCSDAREGAATRRQSPWPVFHSGMAETRPSLLWISFRSRGDFDQIFAQKTSRSINRSM